MTARELKETTEAIDKVRRDLALLIKTPGERVTFIHRLAFRLERILGRAVLGLKDAKGLLALFLDPYIQVPGDDE